jgi:predicted N-acetyltransferase YhbS
MEILHETPKDEKETLRLIQLAFYNVYMPGCEEHLLLKDLRLAKEYLPSLSFIARDQGTIVGAIYASEAKITKGNQVIKVLTFGPLGVLPAYQKKGVGKALVHYFLKEAKKTNYPAIVITGVPTYYPRFGFFKLL